MTALPDFRLETHFSRWEFAARHHLTASDAESMSVADLMAMASPEERDQIHQLWLGYTESRGAPDLREAIAATYETCEAEDILCFAGAEEGLYAAMRVLLDANSHAVVITPNYQSAETIPSAICETSGVPLDPDQGWALDVERIEAALRPNTRVVSVNFPHNPTGAIPPDDVFEALIALCEHRGIRLFSDEVYRPLGPTGARHLPQASDQSSRALSLNVTSKAYGLPGLRLGWIACRDRELLGRLERQKHYLSICNSGPSERLALVALRNREAIIGRNCELVTKNLAHLDTFFARWPTLFEWIRPDGGCVGYPRYKGPDGVEAFARGALESQGVLLLPASIYRSELTPTPQDRFRIGFGRAAVPEGLAALEDYLEGVQPVAE